MEKEQHSLGDGEGGGPHGGARAAAPDAVPTPAGAGAPLRPPKLTMHLSHWIMRPSSLWRPQMQRMTSSSFSCPLSFSGTEVSLLSASLAVSPTISSIWAAASCRAL